MNDEYLWQKTGEDPEVEKLEKVLSVFRYREAVAPAMVADREALEEKRPRWRLSLTLAFASSVAVTILAVMWIQLGGEKSESLSTPDLVFVSGSENLTLSVPAAVEPPAVKNRDLPPRPARSHGRNIKRTTASLERRVKAKDSPVRDTVAALTDEEKYAYRQLMLALSISSSKLKIVQDTINGSEETGFPGSTNQR